MRKFVGLLVMLLCPVMALAGTATLSCTPPSANDDGSALTDLAGFRIYFGTSPASLTSMVTVARPSPCGGVVDNLAAGTWYFAVTAYTAAGAESLDSAVASKVIAAAPPTCPAAPANESRTQACVAPLVGSWTQTHGWSAAASPTCWTADPWTPASAPAGACATPPPLLTAGPYAYEPTGTVAAPTMSAIGLVPKGVPCGPAVRQVGAVKFCEIPITLPGLHLPGWPGDKWLAQGIWARAQ